MIWRILIALNFAATLGLLWNIRTMHDVIAKTKETTHDEEEIDHEEIYRIQAAGQEELDPHYQEALAAWKGIKVSYPNPCGQARTAKGKQE